MAEQARVSSIDALETFRAAVIVFLDKAHRSIDEAGDEMRRTRVWVQQEQRLHWEREARRRQRVLDAAQQELLAAKLSGLRDNLKLQQDAVRKAKEAMREAEEKMRNVRRWSRDFSHFVEPLGRRLETMRQYLDYDLPKALAFLLQAQQTLSAYADIGPKTSGPTSPPAESPASTAPPAP